MTAEFPVAKIDTAALRHNLDCVRATAPGSPVIAVIKANGYGHHAPIVAAALSSAEALGVARVEEGIAVRERGFGHRIVVLEGAGDFADFGDAARYRLDLVIHDKHQLEMLEQLTGTASYDLWLKLDTGMNRLGFSHRDGFGEAVSRLRKNPQVIRSLRFMTHLASADLRKSKFTERQIEAFNDSVRDESGEVSIANSAGLLAWPGSRRGWVRPGIMLYGISPFAEQNGDELGLKPVMHFETRLIGRKSVRTGSTVGYCGTWTAVQDTWIGTAAVGYGDGYPGNLPTGTPVLINGSRVPIVGRVSMDMIMVDLGPQPVARVGDDVTLWGPGLAVEEIARLAGRLSYELVCGVSQRVPRVVANAGR